MRFRIGIHRRRRDRRGRQTCSATRSISPPGWRRSPSPAGYASPVRCATRSEPNCRSPSSISASSRSKISLSRCGPIGCADDTSDSEPSEREVAAAPLPLPDKPSIAVLPFANMSGDPEQEYFADGMVEEIITALSRIRWLFVIARNSSFTYKGQAVDVKQVGRDLGVRYVLEGSVRKAGQRVRITAQLIDADHRRASLGRPVRRLARRHLRTSGQVAISVAGVIEPALAGGRNAPLRRAPDDRPQRLRSLPARACGFLSKNEGTDFEALGLLEQAIAIDPHYGPALAWAANVPHAARPETAGQKSRTTSRRKAIDLARRALEVARDDPGILANAAFALAYFGEDIGAMIGLVDRALALNPSYARGWNLSGLLRIFAGQHDLAIEHIETSLRLSPRERMGAPLSRDRRRPISSNAGLTKRRRSCSWPFKTIRAVPPPTAFSPRAMPIWDGSTKRERSSPGCVPLPLRSCRAICISANPEDRELFLSGLRLAAGEET